MRQIEQFFKEPITLLLIPAVLIALVLHEMSHGYAAYRLGDPTAKEKGRLSINPLRHIDPVGGLMLLLFGFGWAKPVSVDMRYFKNPRRGFALTALAGPASNFIIAFIAVLALAIYDAAANGGIYAVLYNAWGDYLYAYTNETPLFGVFEMFLYYLAKINIGLGVFNLIPFPPLDGSKIVGLLLSDRAYYTVLRYERYGMFLLFAVLFSGVLDTPLTTAMSAVYGGLLQTALLPVRLIFGS